MRGGSSTKNVKKPPPTGGFPNACLYLGFKYKPKENNRNFSDFPKMSDTLFGFFQLEYFVFFVLGTSVYNMCTKGHDYLMSLIIFEVNLVALNLGFVLTSYY